MLYKAHTDAQHHPDCKNIHTQKVREKKNLREPITSCNCEGVTCMHLNLTNCEFHCFLPFKSTV